jgi:zinc protease
MKTHAKTRYAKKPYALGIALSLAIATSLSGWSPANWQPAMAIAAPAAVSAPALKAPEITTVQTMAGPIQELTLANGLKVILKEDHAAPVVTWMVYYKVGSRNEVIGTTGSTHLLEHMLFKGTKTLGKGQVAQLLGRNGASFNASTWTDWTNYYETYSSDRLEMGLMIESARMRDALILDSERQSEMTVVRNELERGESNPGRLLYQEVTSAAYKAHPYHHPVIGWRTDVEGVATSDLKKFYDTFYHPNNAVAVLVGDFRTPEAVSLIQQYFGKIPAGPKPPQLYTQEEPQVGERRVTLRRRGETNMVQMAYHVPSVESKDIAPLLVLDTVLSSGVTDRLHQALVEKQLATGTYAYTGVQRDPSLFRVGATVKPGVGHEVVERALLAELEKLKAERVSAPELQKAKNQAEASYVYQNEGTAGLAAALGSYEAIHRWQRAFELLDEIKQVTAEDVQRVAKTYLTGDNRTVGWYVATPDGPVPPKPTNADSGKAVANAGKVVPAKPFPFEERPARLRALTPPIRKVLSNGMTVLVLPNSAAPTVAVSGFVRAGSLQDPKGKEGRAAATAAMLDKGTATRSKLQLASDLETVAASVGFSGGTETTGISAKMLSKDLDLGLTALAEMLQEPVFPADELAKLKTRWIAGIKQGEDQPQTHAARALSQAIYPEGHPYRELNPAEQIAAIEELDVSDLKAFHARTFGPNATTLIVVGQVDADALVTKLEALFKTWKPVTLAEVAIPETPRKPPQRIVIPMMDKSNLEILLGHAGSVTRRSPEFHASSLANYILGGSGLSSRLGVKLRDEMGLTYGTSSSFSASSGAGAWEASITVNPANMDTAITALKAEVEGFLSQGITAEELAAAKGAYIGRQAVSLATNGGMASSLSTLEYYDLGLDYWSRYPSVINAITLDQVNAAARKLIAPESAHLIIAGPHSEK